MEGPMVNIVASDGRFALIHSPASRPPGTPPVPATNTPVVGGWIAIQLVFKSNRIISPPEKIRIQSVLKRLSPAPRFSIQTQRVKVRLAKIAMAGAIGSKY